ncbi:hypothetical protein [Gordonia sp. VNK21]|uniref:hypothetical protein n=1 Tax=Gordonia sp. VNK21 TaxID=3382483 RepID=UPI0038D498FA
MPARLLPAVIVVLSITTIVLTTLGWFTLRPLGPESDVSWNSFGSGDFAIAEAPDAHGWLIVLACVAAIVVALCSWLPSLAPYRRTSLVVIGVGALAASIIPITVIANPDWYLDDLFTALGEPDRQTGLPASEFIGMPVVASTLALLLLLAVTAFAAAVLAPAIAPDQPAPVRTEDPSGAVL